MLRTILQSSLRSAIPCTFARSARTGAAAAPQKRLLSTAIQPGVVTEVKDADDFKNRTQIVDQLVVVDFYATWCAPCKIMSPLFQQAAKKHEDVSFLKVDVDANPEVAANCDVEAMPTFIFLKDGALVNKQVGAVSADQLENLIVTSKKVKVA